MNFGSCFTEAGSSYVSSTATSSKPARTIKQKRGQKTFDALMQSGMELLNNRDFSQFSVEKLTQQAGYSVGTFYTRFRSKDEFLDALLDQHLQHRMDIADDILNQAPREKLARQLITSIFNFYHDHRWFWRYILMERISQPTYWERYKTHGTSYNLKLIARIRLEIDRQLNAEEEARIRFASQMMHGWLNYMISNATLDDEYPQKDQHMEQLIRAYSMVSGIDDLLTTA